jgi:hypothetical protein
MILLQCQCGNISVYKLTLLDEIDMLLWKFIYVMFILMIESVDEPQTFYSIHDGNFTLPPEESTDWTFIAICFPT